LAAGPARAGCCRGVVGVGSRRGAPLPLGPWVGWGCRSDIEVAMGAELPVGLARAGCCGAAVGVGSRRGAPLPQGTPQPSSMLDFLPCNLKLATCNFFPSRRGAPLPPGRRVGWGCSRDRGLSFWWGLPGQAVPAGRLALGRGQGRSYGASDWGLWERPLGYFLPDCLRLSRSLHGVCGRPRSAGRSSRQ